MKDSQYDYMKEVAEDRRTNLGLVSNSTWRKDPKRFLFSLSRYKFVSKVLANSNNVLEVGCGDGWNAKLVSETVKKLTLTDYCEDFVEEAKLNSRDWANQPTCLPHNFCELPLTDDFFDAVDRNAKSDALCPCVDGGVDSDNFTGEVEQRST